MLAPDCHCEAYATARCLLCGSVLSNFPNWFLTRSRTKSRPRSARMLCNLVGRLIPALSQAPLHLCPSIKYVASIPDQYFYELCTPMQLHFLQRPPHTDSLRPGPCLPSPRSSVLKHKREFSAAQFLPILSLQLRLGPSDGVSVWL